MKKQVIFRVNATSKIGFGHFRRCLSLAEILKDGGFFPSLVTNQGNPLLSPRIKSIFDPIIEIPEAHPDPLISKIKELQAMWVILDGEEFTPENEKSILENAKLLRIVDSPNRKYFCTTLLSQNFAAEHEKFETGSGSRLALGLGYVLLSKKIRTLVPPAEEVFHSPIKVLVTLGGSSFVDRTLVEKFAEAFAQLPKDSFQIKWVGSQESCEIILGHKKQFKNLVECRNFSDGLEDLMFETHFGISSVGTTMWELLYLNKPFLALPLNLEQENYLAKMVKGGLCWGLPRASALSSEFLLRRLLDLQRSQAALDSMKGHQKKALDREGLERRILGLFN